MPKEQRKKTLRQSHEARVLLEMLKQIRSQLPPDPRVLLGEKLKEAIKGERYEEAADLRDQLNAMKSEMANPKMAASREADATPGDSSMPPKMPKAARPKKARKPRSKKADDSDGA
jgi:hypothetical protein